MTMKYEIMNYDDLSNMKLWNMILTGLYMVIPSNSIQYIGDYQNLGNQVKSPMCAYMEVSINCGTQQWMFFWEKSYYSLP